MTATDKMRHLLDERGVEYRTHGMTDREWFEVGDTSWFVIERENGSLAVQAVFLTPDQAIEATVGRGECRNLIAHIQGQMPMLHCEECGCTTTLNVPSGGAGYIGETEMGWPLYCAKCGRKVEV